MSCCCSRTASSCSAPSDGGWRWHRGCCIHRHPLCEVVPGAVQAWPAAVRGGAIIIMAVPCHGCCARYSTHCTVHSTLTMGSALMPACMLTMSSSSVSVCIACLACPVSPRVTCHRCVRLRCPHATAGQLQYFDINPPHSALGCSLLGSALRPAVLAAARTPATETQPGPARHLAAPSRAGRCRGGLCGRCGAGAGGQI